MFGVKTNFNILFFSFLMNQKEIKAMSTNGIMLKAVLIEKTTLDQNILSTFNFIK